MSFVPSEPLKKKEEPTQEDASGSILDKILKADNLPALPAVAFQVYEQTRRENVAVPQIAKTLERDPVFTAKLLKMVNSALFALPNKIASVPQAIVILGLRTVKVMALFTIVNKMGENIDKDFDYEKYWRRSLTTAVSSRLLAEKYDQAVADEAFVAGLLADLGILAAMHGAPKEYKEVVKEIQETNMPPQVVEAKQLGLTHADIGAAMLLSWGLPYEVAHAAQHHHSAFVPPTEDDNNHLTPLVWAAAKISDLFCEDSTRPDDLDEFITSLCADLNTALGERAGEITPDEIDQIFMQIDELVQSTASQIEVQIGQTSSYDELRAAAMSQLADLSVSAEVDRAAASRMAVSAQKEVEILSTEKDKLAVEVVTDSLTAVANRMAFDMKIAQSIKSGIDTKESVGLIMYDLDSFKSVNDTYGHLFGDEVLKVVGQTLQKVQDETHFVARYGGEEFAIIIDKTTLQELKDIAELVRLETERIQLHYGTRTINITASVGAAQFDPLLGTMSARELIERADQCLLKAKREGGNTTLIAPKNA